MYKDVAYPSASDSELEIFIFWTFFSWSIISRTHIFYVLNVSVALITFSTAFISLYTRLSYLLSITLFLGLGNSVWWQKFIFVIEYLLLTVGVKVSISACYSGFGLNIFFSLLSMLGCFSISTPIHSSITRTYAKTLVISQTAGYFFMVMVVFRIFLYGDGSLQKSSLLHL